MEIVIIILTIITLFGISIFDIETATIPHTLTIILLILGIITCFLNGTNTIVLTLTIFVGVLLFQFILFCIYGENAIGGGDVKILSISMLFISNINDIYNYCFALTLLTFVGYFYSTIKKQTHLKYGPYMSLSLITTILLSYSLNISDAILIETIFVFFLFFIDILFFEKERWLNNIEKECFELFKKDKK